MCFFPIEWFFFCSKYLSVLCPTGVNVFLVELSLEKITVYGALVSVVWFVCAHQFVFVCKSCYLWRASHAFDEFWSNHHQTLHTSHTPAAPDVISLTGKDLNLSHEVLCIKASANVFELFLDQHHWIISVLMFSLSSCIRHSLWGIPECFHTPIIICFLGSPWCSFTLMWSFSRWWRAGCVWDASCSTHHSCVFVFLSESLIGRRLQRNTCSVRSGSFSAFSFSGCCCWGQKTLRMMDYKACERKSRNWWTDAVLELQMCAVEPLHSSALTQMCSSTLTVD